MTKGDFLAAYNIGHRDGKEDVYCPNDYDDIFDIKQQPNDNEQIIRIKKGTLKARTGRYVIYDVEWLKTHFNTTEAKIYGQPNEDCISRKAVLDALHSYFADGFDGDKWWNSTYVLDAINKVPSVTPQPEKRTEEHTETHECDCISRIKDRILERIETYIGDIEFVTKQELTEDEKTILTSVKDIINSEFVREFNTQLHTEHIIKSTIKEYLDKNYTDVTELLLALNKDLCERIRKENENGL